jgi:fumarate reductase subunit D
MQTDTNKRSKTSNLQRLGGAAALAQAAVYVAAMVLFLGILIPAGYGASTDPIENVAFLADNQAAVYTVNVLVYVASSVLVAVLALALYNLLKDSAPVLMQTATVFGLIWAGVLIATGMIASIGLSSVIDLYIQDPAQAASLWMATEVVQEGLGGGTEIVGGIWMALASWAALRAGMLPRLLTYLGIGVGVAGILSVVPALAGLVDVFGLGGIIWFAWLGIAMLRNSRSRLNDVQQEASTKRPSA